MALLEHLEREVRKHSGQALGDLRVVVGVALAAQCEVDGSLQVPKRVEVEFAGPERPDKRVQPRWPLRHPRRRRSRRSRGWLDTRSQVATHERRHQLVRRQGHDPVELSPYLLLGRVERFVPRPRGLEQREAAQPLRVLCGEGQARGAATGVADEVEPVEPRGLSHSQDSRDLDIERIVRRGLLARVDLEFLCHRLDLVTESLQQCPICQVRREHGPRKQDHLWSRIH